LKKIAFITASPETISSFLLAYVGALAEKYEIHVITNLNGLSSVRGLPENFIVHDINIARNPDIFRDIGALYQLYKLFKQQQYDVIHSFTPKAGLLSQLSSYAARIEYRFHTFTGQVWATKSGASRFLLRFLDSITATLSTHSLVDSPSQQQFLIEEKLLTNANSTVLASGSISGVNIENFNFSAELREQLRAKHNFKNDDFIFLFVGRLKVEKGVPELLNAFKTLQKTHAAKLILIGTDEDNLTSLYSKEKNIHYIGFKTNISDYYSMADVLCLPSHREGFGNVIIEAASCKLPAIASNIYGLSDAVSHNVSGLLHPVKDGSAILSCMKQIIENPMTLKEMKEKSRTRIENTFDEKLLIQEFVNFYEKKL